MKIGRALYALVLIAAGVALLLINMNYLTLRLYNQWPLAVVLVGLGMWAGVLDNRRNWGLAIPGTILLCAGALLYCCANISWRLMIQWWPVFIIAPGLSFFLAYLVGGREWGLLIPASILTVVGLSLLTQTVLGGADIFLPVALIGAGAVVLLTSLQKRKGSSPT